MVVVVEVERKLRKLKRVPSLSMITAFTFTFASAFVFVLVIVFALFIHCDFPFACASCIVLFTSKDNIMHIIINIVDLLHDS